MRARRSPEDLPAGELLRQVLDESKELVRLEVKLAREEVRGELKQLRTAAILGVIAGALAIVAVAMFGLAVVIAMGNTAADALIVACIVTAAMAVLALMAWRRLPKNPLQRTRERLTSDIRELKEHVER